MIRLLILTDHATHSVNNSVYGLAKALNDHAEIVRLSIASRGFSKNHDFFNGSTNSELWGIEHENAFDFPADEAFNERAKLLDLKDFDFIFLRLPRPIHKHFFKRLIEVFPEEKMINRPSGIIKTGSKAYLLNFSSFTAPIQLVESFSEIEKISKRFPIVLKPLEEYGGKGIIKVSSDGAEVDGVQYSISAFKKIYEAAKKPYLAMQFLKNVKNGDKRIVVAGGQVLSASLRLPADGNWLCNIAQGGSSEDSKADERELEIISNIDPILQKEGIFYYGLDTLENDEGLRVISEVNTLSIGGIVTPAHEDGEQVAKHFASLMINYMKNHL